MDDSFQKDQSNQKDESKLDMFFQMFDWVDEDISELNEDEENKDSTNKPSSEWRFHRDIYVNKKESNAIVHAHSPHATAVSSHGKSIPPFHYMIALAGGDAVSYTHLTLPTKA